MCGDEEEHPGAKEDGPEDESDKHLPPAAAGLRMSLFVIADGGSGCVIEQPGALPARQPAF
jgi:hypothetical protein